MYRRNLIKGINTRAGSRRILEAILKMDTGRTQTNGPEERKLMIMCKTLHPRDDIDYMCKGKKEEEDSPVKITERTT